MTGEITSSEIPPSPVFEESDELRIHEFEFIRDIQANNPFGLEKMGKLLLQAVAVAPFHHEYDVRPFDLFA